MENVSQSYSLLVSSQIGGAEGVGLSNDGDKIDARTQALHDLNIEGLQSVTGGSDKIQTGMHTHIDLICAAGLLLLQHVGLMLIVEELNDGLPGIAVVDVVSESGGIDDGQANCKNTSRASAVVQRTGSAMVYL